MNHGGWAQTLKFENHNTPANLRRHKCCLHCTVNQDLQSMELDQYPLTYLQNSDACSVHKNMDTCDEYKINFPQSEYTES